MTRSLDLIASASRFAIAAAIVYFAYQLAQINNNVPAVLQSVDQVSQHIDPALGEVAAIRAEITEVRKLVPQMLSETAEVRKQIPPILAQVESINQQIDPILLRVDKTVAVVDDTQRQIPEILTTTDNAITALNETRAEVVPLVPQVLEEVKLTRESVDPTLDRVEILVDDAYSRAMSAIGAATTAGQEASEGAVKGFFTGLIKLPFNLIGTLASPLTKNMEAEVAEQLMESDLELMVEAGERGIKSKKIGQEQRWENPESGNSGSLTLVRTFELEGFECHEVRIRISNQKQQQIQDRTDEFCLNEENKWVLAAEIGK
jgi:surface antigen/archaellum component FlaC